MSQILYLVGSKIRPLTESCGEDFFLPTVPREAITTPVLAVFYRDTRNEPGHGGHSNYFTSSVNPLNATTYTDWQSAQDWNAQFLEGEGVVYRF